MNEPLTNSASRTRFSGKSHNHHPQWSNQPIRLIEKEKRDPLLVLDDFFECYHLRDVREKLWEWVSEVVTSPNEIASEPLERSSNLYFYEKVEGLIEAAHILRRKIHKHRRKRQKIKSKKIAHSTETGSRKVNMHAKSDAVTVIDEAATQEHILNKPKQLQEYTDEDPMYVITEVFKNESLDFLRNQLRDWRHIALSADCAIYEEGEQREQLLTFYDHLLELTEALFIIYAKNQNSSSTRHMIEAEKQQILSQEQIANPMQVVSAFFDQFPLNNAIRELNDWQEASICFTGVYPENMSPLSALITYRNVLCLIKAANRLISWRFDLLSNEHRPNHQSGLHTTDASSPERMAF
ncbi:hypothetical protein [Longitalea luteola]|uniref:hypothetical protein n=1 Tax=Longitalea luteola TaxID=2812563 RepID=UPI001A9597AA|nr:hypothetical protein [Longitalea luteola]